MSLKIKLRQRYRMPCTTSAMSVPAGISYRIASIPQTNTSYVFASAVPSIRRAVPPIAKPLRNWILGCCWPHYNSSMVFKNHGLYYSALERTFPLLIQSYQGTRSQLVYFCCHPCISKLPRIRNTQYFVLQEELLF
jgi:hypothetical protein